MRRRTMNEGNAPISCKQEVDLVNSAQSIYDVCFQHMLSFFPRRGKGGTGP